MTDAGDLLARLERLAASGERALVGIAGPPGAGKSSLAAELAGRLGGRAVLAPMDGFHLSDRLLGELGLADRKGAPETFDADGFVALLRRLRARTDKVVYAPLFRRELELAEAGAVAIPQEAPLVITEGNYLLCDGPFGEVRSLLDLTVFLHVAPEERRRRLLARHICFGRSAEEAEAWVERTDEPNARLVEPTSPRADVVLAP